MRYVGLLLEVLLMLSAGAAWGAAPSAVEMLQARRWVAAKLEGGGTVPLPASGLVIQEHYDLVWQNCRVDRPLVVAKRAHRQGLATHAPSKVLVRLPGPAKSFSAILGVDSNGQTAGGRGSVVFSASTAPGGGPPHPNPLLGGEGGKPLFQSPVLHEGMRLPIKLDLPATREIVLQVGEAGDGIACDQAVWAEAKVTLRDGRTLYLGDMPIIGGQDPAPVDGALPFSFTYGGKPADIAGWPCQRSTKRLDPDRTEHTLTWADPATRLELRCVAVEYHDFPTVEWTLYLANRGTTDTPVIEDLRPLDARFSRLEDDVYRRHGRAGEFVLHHHVGSVCEQRDYQPLETPLGAGETKHIATRGGRSSDAAFPYWNLAWPGEGVITAIGWPGQWAADFDRDEATGVRVRAGQELTHFVLHPGEEVRTPLVVLQFWQGDRVRAQNVWRQWMLAHNVPRPGGKLHPFHLSGCSSHFFGEMVTADEASQVQFIDRYRQERIKIDYWWMDAGWYVIKDNWPETGTWEVDTRRFPRGLRAITDHAHKTGLQTIVWFEPERVAPGTWLATEHPEWLLSFPGDGGQKLFDHGNPVARQWLTDHIDGLLVSQGIDLYREDMNCDPLPYWRAADAPDRQGLTEIRYVTGHLAYWDELRRRHPDLLIDDCCSGGRRNDLESMRRAVPLWRSDYILEPIGVQSCTYGISSWLPLHGTGVKEADRYLFRSMVCPYPNCLWDARRTDLDYNLLRKLTGEWRQVAPYYLGDYYPLTSYSLQADVWVAWQFDRPDLGEGMVQAFRRDDCLYESGRLRLRGLDPDATYEVRDLDRRAGKRMSGAELLELGVPVTITEQPGAVVIVYKKARS